MNVIYSVLVTAVWFLSVYFNVVLLIILFTNKSSIFKPKELTGNLPKVSIVVPAYNEESSIVDSIESLKKIDYPKEKLEILVVSDGSTDKTAELAKGAVVGTPNIKVIDNKKNQGKAASLNQGILMAKGEYIATMDADSEASPDILKKTIPHFEKDRVGAVIVSVEVKSPKNILQKIIEIEYVIGLSLALKALSFFDAVHVTPGPFSIYKRSVLDEIGLFDVTNITEDLEIAYRIQKHRYKIDCCNATKVRTITPDTFKELYTQRKRWYTGALCTIKQHKDIILNKKVGPFGFVVPYTYMLVFLGLGLFLFSIYLTISNTAKSFAHFSLTGFNFWSYLTFQNFDVLNYGALSILGISAISMTVISAYLYLKLAKKQVRSRMPGFVGFAALFFLYQLFWMVSIYAFVRGNKVKWR